MIFIFLVVLLFLLVFIGGATKFSKRKFRPVVFATLSMVLLTPSFAPATVVVVPVPFGVILAIGVFAGAVHEIPGLVSLFWQWHMFAFPTTWVAFYLLYLLGIKYARNKLKNA